MPHQQPQVRLGIITLEEEESSSNHHSHRRGGWPTHHTIGTIVTIQYTHERMESTTTTIAPINQPRDELIFTAVGTGRFEFQKAISEDPLVWMVRELDDVPLMRPPIGRLVSSRPSWLDRHDGDENDKKDDDKDNDDDKVKSTSTPTHQDQVIWNLSLLTPTPHFVYQRYWPWKIVDELKSLLSENRNGTNLPHLDLDGTGSGGGKGVSSSSKNQSSPMEFSYYLAGNMPFTQNERLELLRMPSTLERLLTIRQKVLELVQEHRTQYLGCVQCGQPLCRVREVFSFDGAEGATSNYVNDHGYIHQVTTIREVLDHRSIYHAGPPSTENRYGSLMCDYYY
jgi:hypothetical protein